MGKVDAREDRAARDRTGIFAVAKDMRGAFVP